MTLVADTLELARQARESDIQAMTGVFLEGFDPAFDHPLNWGLDRVTPSELMAISNTLIGSYRQLATQQLGPLNGFSQPGPAGPQPLIVNRALAWGSLTNQLPASGFTITTRARDGVDSITDDRRSRLYISVDMNEWVEFRNRDVVHLVANNWYGFSPLGQSTVWLKADAWIQHNRGKSARIYLQGRIAERLQRQLIEGETISPQDFVNKILDADAETAYSSIHGPC